ncbi:MAG: ABC transporter permease [Gammaproteobacteria bacterium]|nr:ABC transporter permease [Gammaproteobacteria bacterium]
MRHSCRSRVRLIHYFDLVLYKTYADLRADSERTYIGFLWWLFNPSLSMIIYYLVFGLMLGQSGGDFVPNLMVGIIFFQWFSTCVSHGASTIMDGHSLMMQVYLPKIIFPIVNILVDSIKFLFVFIILVIVINLLGHPINLAYLSLPLLMLAQLLLIAAVAFFMAGVTPFFPDLRLLFDHLLHLLFFMSGVFFTVDTIPERFRGFYYLNPMANLIEQNRRVLLHGEFPEWSSLAIISCGTLIGLILSIWLITWLDQVYPKIAP